MSPADAVVRRATPEDHDAVVATVTAAFASDPAWEFITAGEVERLSPHFASALFEGRAAAGTVWVTDDCRAVAMWDDRSGAPQPQSHQARIWDDYRAVAGERAWDRLQRYEQALHPHEHSRSGTSASSPHIPRIRAAGGPPRSWHPPYDRRRRGCRLLARDLGRRQHGVLRATRLRRPHRGRDRRRADHVVDAAPPARMSPHARRPRTWGAGPRWVGADQAPPPAVAISPVCPLQATPGLGTRSLAPARTAMP